MSAITAKASRKMKKYAVLTREPRSFLGSFDFSWEQRKLGELVDVCSGRDYKHLSEGTIPVYGTGGYMLSVNDALSYDRDAIGIGRKGTIDRPYILKAPFWTVDTLFYAIPREKVDLNFAFDIFQNIDWKKKDESTGVPSLSKTAINDIDVLAPKHDEQQTIGQFFAALDDLITLHQRKCANLCSPSQVVFSLLFATSTFSWEQRKVGDLLIERNQQAPMSDEYPLMAFIANEGVAPKGERYDRSALVTDTVNKLYKKTEKGDFIYSSNNLETGSIGLNKYGKACISPVYSIFEPTGIADSDFLGRRLVRKDFINAMVKWRQGVIYGQWRIHESDFLKIEITVPSVEEQRKIGAYLDQLDNLITLHQRECISFTGRADRLILTANKKRTTSSWEQRKLGDIADIVGGGTPSTGNQSYWDGDIDWYAPAEIADQIYANSSQKKITGLGYENSSAKMLPPGTVLFTSRAGIGKTAILTRKGCTNQGFQSIVPHRGELDSYFIFSRTGELKRYGELVGAGSTFVEVSGKQMAVMELMMPPTMREQQTIGGFFQQLDHLITLHQRKPFLMKWRTSDANRNQTNRLVL